MGHTEILRQVLILSDKSDFLCWKTWLRDQNAVGLPESDDKGLVGFVGVRFFPVDPAQCTGSEVKVPLCIQPVLNEARHAHTVSRTACVLDTLFSGLSTDVARYVVTFF